MPIIVIGPNGPMELGEGDDPFDAIRKMMMGDESLEPKSHPGNGRGDDGLAALLGAMNGPSQGEDQMPSHVKLMIGAMLQDNDQISFVFEPNDPTDGDDDDYLKKYLRLYAYKAIRSSGKRPEDIGTIHVDISSRPGGFNVSIHGPMARGNGRDDGFPPEVAARFREIQAALAGLQEDGDPFEALQEAMTNGRRASSGSGNRDEFEKLRVSLALRQLLARGQNQVIFSPVPDGSPEPEHVTFLRNEAVNGLRQQGDDPRNYEILGAQFSESPSGIEIAYFSGKRQNGRDGFDARRDMVERLMADGEGDYLNRMSRIGEALNRVAQQRYGGDVTQVTAAELKAALDNRSANDYDPGRIPTTPDELRAALLRKILGGGDSGLDGLIGEIRDSLGSDKGYPEVLRDSLDAELNKGIDKCQNPLCPDPRTCGVTVMLQARKREREAEARRNRREPRPDEIREEMFRRMGRTSNPEPQARGLTEVQVANAMSKAIETIAQKREIQLALLPLQAFGGLIAFVMAVVSAIVGGAKWLFNNVVAPVGIGLYYSLGAVAILLTAVNVPAMYIAWTLGLTDPTALVVVGSMFGWLTPAVAAFVHGAVFHNMFRLSGETKTGRVIWYLRYPDRYNHGLHAFFGGIRVAGIKLGRQVSYRVLEFNEANHERHVRFEDWKGNIRITWDEMRRAVADLEFREHLIDDEEDLDWLYSPWVFRTAKAFQWVDDLFNETLPTMYRAFSNEDYGNVVLMEPILDTKPVLAAARFGYFMRHDIPDTARALIGFAEAMFDIDEREKVIARPEDHTPLQVEGARYGYWIHMNVTWHLMYKTSGNEKWSFIRDQLAFVLGFVRYQRYVGNLGINSSMVRPALTRGMEARNRWNQTHHPVDHTAADDSID